MIQELIMALEIQNLSANTIYATGVDQRGDIIAIDVNAKAVLSTNTEKLVISDSPEKLEIYGNRVLLETTSR